MFGPEWIRINWLIETAQSAVSKRGFFFAASAAKFWKRYISSASESAFPGFFGDTFGCTTPFKKRCFSTQNSLASYQRCSHSVEPRALTCPFKQSKLSTWSYIQICRLWVRHSPCCTLYLINCFGIEMVLCDLYLKRFDLTEGLLFDTFSITVWYKFCRYDHSVLKLESFSPPMN